MNPLFTVHAGEYVVGSYIEQHFKRVNVWVPSKDKGIDLLVSDRRNRRTVSLQVKFSKDYLEVDMTPVPLFLKELRACGWWTIDRRKLRESQADFWVFALQGFARRTIDFIIVPPKEFLRRLRSIHGPLKKRIDTYLWVTVKDRCWETRNLQQKYRRQIAEGEYREPRRDFRQWLNNWSAVARLNR
jgi:hypothetical protein